MTRHRITHYTHTRHGLTWHCRCGATGAHHEDDQARRDGREHVRGGGGR